MNRRQFLRTLEAGSVSAAAIGAVPDFTPPDNRPVTDDTASTGIVSPADARNYIFTNENELGRVKQRVADGDEPWTSAHDRMMDAARSALDTGNITYDEDASRGNAPRARKVIRNAALGYYFSDEDRFAESAIDKLHHFLLNDGTSYRATDPVIPHARIINSITVPELLFAASLVRDHPYWEQKGGERQMQEWCRTYIRTCKEYSREQWGDERLPYQWPQNRVQYRIVDRLANAAYLGDEELFDETVRLWKSFNNAKLPFDDSRPNRHIWPSGKPNDTSRSEGWEYALYAVDSVVSVAEVARHQGYDLYTWQDSPEASDIHKEYHRGEPAGPLIPRLLRWMNGVFADPSTWDELPDTTPLDKLNGTKPPNIGPTGRGIIGCEYANSYFHGTQLGTRLNDVVDQYIRRPAYNRKNTGHVTLTHADLFDTVVQTSTRTPESTVGSESTATSSPTDADGPGLGLPLSGVAIGLYVALRGRGGDESTGE